MQNSFTILGAATNFYFVSSDYRHSFNGMEKENEITGSESHLNFGARIYDSRVGRWLSGDPLGIYYTSVAPYVFGLNNPIYFVDFNGNVIIDANGNVVKINYENGVPIGFNSEGVDPTTAEAINLYLSSDVGKSQLTKIDQSVTQSNFVFSDEAKFSYNETAGKNELVFGEVTDGGKMIKDADGNEVFEKATITVYMGSYEILANGIDVIKDDVQYTQEFKSPTGGQSSEIKTSGKKIKEEGIMFEGDNPKINKMTQNYKGDINLFKQGILIHESVHMEAENIKIQRAKKSKWFDSEIPAYIKEYELHEEKGIGL